MKKDNRRKNLCNIKFLIIYFDLSRNYNWVTLLHRYRLEKNNQREAHAIPIFEYTYKCLYHISISTGLFAKMLYNGTFRTSFDLRLFYPRVSLYRTEMSREILDFSRLLQTSRHLMFGWMYTRYAFLPVIYGR